MHTSSLSAHGAYPQHRKTFYEPLNSDGELGGAFANGTASQSKSRLVMRNTKILASIEMMRLEKSIYSRQL